MSALSNLIYGIIVFINFLGMVIVKVDKDRAVRHRRRIPEKAFFWLAIAGGSAGVFAGCLLFHHKTKHLRFMVGLPIILLFQIGLILYWFNR